MDDDTKKDLYNRLSRIDGQVKAIQRMLESDFNCREILTQIVAARAALTKVGTMVIESSAKECFLKETEKEDESLKELISSLTMLIK